MTLTSIKSLTHLSHLQTVTIEKAFKATKV